MKSDAYKARVYHLERLDRFMVVDYRAKPKIGDVVMVDQLSDREIVIARYNGCPYYGVVRFLSSYNLQFCRLHRRTAPDKRA